MQTAGLQGMNIALTTKVAIQYPRFFATLCLSKRPEQIAFSLYVYFYRLSFEINRNLTDSICDITKFYLKKNFYMSEVKYCEEQIKAYTSCYVQIWL